MKLNSSERKGMLVLFSLTVLLFMLPSFFRTEDAFFLLVEDEAADSTTRMHSANKKPRPIELNTADSSTLLKVKGIGPYYATKILRYREALGGFYRKEQLKELTFQYLNIDSILPFFTADPALIRKKSMDSMDFKSILRHPYLEYEDVVLIFEAKRKWGKADILLLEEKGVLSSPKLKRIKPYFK